MKKEQYLRAFDIAYKEYMIGKFLCFKFSLGFPLNSIVKHILPAKELQKLSYGNKILLNFELFRIPFSLLYLLHYWTLIFHWSVTPHHQKVVVLFINLRSLPLTLMIHFVNVQTSKLEQHMQVHVYHISKRICTKWVWTSFIK